MANGDVTSDGFERALTLTLSFEGGYSDHPLDSGGATNMGITRATLARVRRRPVSKAEVMALSHAEAAAIYRCTYWDKIGGDGLPAGIGLLLFDYAVNSGVARAVGALRAALGLPRGPLTDDVLASCAATNVVTLIRSISRQRLAFLQRLASFRTFGRGWSRRVAAVEAAALRATKS